MAKILLGNIKGPQGAQGPTGPQGPQGVQGNPGQGVPTGGSAGQYLIKQSGTNYDADWGAITTDSAPTSGGTNPITSGGVYTEAGKLAAGMEILANGNTHAAIASGQFVYVRGHGTLADGTYKATANIAANGTLSSSNLTAQPSGGMNALNSNLSNNVFQEIAPTGTRCTVVSGGVAVVGNLAVINVKILSAYSATNTPSMLSVDIGAPKCVTALSCVKSGTTQGSMSGAIACHIGTNRQIYMQSVENDAYYDISGVVVLA